MSGTENNVTFDAPVQISDDDFQKIYQAELKLMGGNPTEHRALLKEINLPPVPKEEEEEEEAKTDAVADAPPVVEEAPQTESETSTEVEASATEGGSEPTTAAAADAQEASDWLAALDAGIRAKVEEILAEKSKLEHKLKSDEGRVAAYQRHFETARLELEAARKAAQNPQSKQPPAQPAAQQGQQQTSQRVIPPEIQAILDVDETLGKALLRNHDEAERANRALKEEIENLKNTSINPLAERQHAIYLQQELDLLEREMPGAKEVLGHDIWDDFKSVATPAVRSLAESTNRFEVATALQEYQAWIQRPDVQAWAAKKYGAATQQQQQEPAKTQTQQQPARQVDPQQVAKAEAVKAAAERKASSSPVASNVVSRPVKKERTLDEIIDSGDQKALKEWHERQFEEELAKVEGRKSKYAK